MKRADLLEIGIDHCDLDGDGVGTAEDRAVHVPGLFSSESAQVRVAHVSKQRPVAHAVLVELHTRHPERREPACINHAERGGHCGGCPWMALEEPAQRAEKRRMLKACFGISVPEVLGDDALLGYRHSSKRVAFSHFGRLALGSYRRGSHDGAWMRGCLVDHPKLRELADALEDAANRHAIEPFDEATRKGDLRYVWLKTDGTRVLVTLVTASEQSRAAELLPAELAQASGVLWSVQAEEGNALRGTAPRLLTGDGALRAEVLGIDVDLGPLGFLQPNPKMAARIYADLIAGPDGAPLAGKRAFDLYAGAGVTTALLRARFGEVLACESYAESARALGITPSTAQAFLEQHAGGPAPELVVANPPRAGLGVEVCARLRALGAARVHLMSCGPAGFARDLAALCAEGSGARYRLVRTLAYDTLPQTPHVELVAWLERA